MYGNPDGAIIGASYLGIFLLMCAQVAFGRLTATFDSSLRPI